VEVVRDGLGEGFDFSVRVEGDDRGPGLGLVVDRGACVVVVRRCSVGVGVTFLPGVVTVSEDAVVVVVVVVV
jgi:acetyltransferase-like isoleucine patch superfamily enzyme